MPTLDVRTAGDIDRQTVIGVITVAFSTDPMARWAFPDPAYLESSNPRNVPLYQRHGFESIGRIQVGSSPTLVPTLRTPRRP